jgi:hypothetical protein
MIIFLDKGLEAGSLWINYIVSDKLLKEGAFSAVSSEVLSSFGVFLTESFSKSSPVIPSLSFFSN